MDVNLRVKMKIKFEWEALYSYGEVSTARAKVLGGWIVRTVCWSKEWRDTAPRSIALAESSVFIADRDHQWEIDKE